MSEAAVEKAKPDLAEVLIDIDGVLVNWSVVTRGEVWTRIKVWKDAIERFSEDERRISKPNLGDNLGTDNKSISFRGAASSELRESRSTPTHALEETIHNFRCDIEKLWGISNVMSEDIADRAQIFGRIGKNELRAQLKEKIDTRIKVLQKQVDEGTKFMEDDYDEQVRLDKEMDELLIKELQGVLKVLDDSEMEK